MNDNCKIVYTMCDNENIAFSSIYIKRHHNMGSNTAYLYFIENMMAATILKFDSSINQ